MSRVVRVYRSSRTQEMYLYVDFGEDLARVPQALLDRFGKPVPVLTLKLSAERKLARAEAAVVLAQIESAGFYLQMPPPAGLQMPPPPDLQSPPPAEEPRG